MGKLPCIVFVTRTDINYSSGKGQPNYPSGKGGSREKSFGNEERGSDASRKTEPMDGKPVAPRISQEGKLPHSVLKFHFKVIFSISNC